MLYILGIGLGRWAVNRHETGGSLYRWRPPVVTRGSQAVYAKFLKRTYVFKHEHIKCVDLGVLYNLTEVNYESVFLCEL